MKRNEITVGLLGWGTVGAGVSKILEEEKEAIAEQLGSPVKLAMIADLDLERDRGVKIEKKRLTTDAYQIINDRKIDIIVELIGGNEPAKTFICEALKQGKQVVTANKALLAVHGNDLFSLARLQGADLYFEASVGGGIPIIRALREAYIGDPIHSIYSIINGTANYVLTEMTQSKKDFNTVLTQAQKLGYAEADPTYDIGGIDAAHKVAIMSSMAFGSPVHFDDVYVEGISGITPIDIEFADELGYEIKLLGITKEGPEGIEARVHPTMVLKDTPLAAVHGVFNAVYIESEAKGESLLYGKGAGMMPTASAVVSDIVDIGRNIINKSVGRVSQWPIKRREDEKAKIKSVDDVICEHYLRFTVVDRPGVLANIARVLGENSISIYSMIQRHRDQESGVPIVILTHDARGGDVKRALEIIDRLDVVLDKTLQIRIL